MASWMNRISKGLGCEVEEFDLNCLELKKVWIEFENRSVSYLNKRIKQLIQFEIESLTREVDIQVDFEVGGEIEAHFNDETIK